MNKGIVIAGYAGIGKTTLAKKYINVIDLESSNFKYIYDKEEIQTPEKMKGLLNRKQNQKWPNNYYSKIKNSILEYDFVCIQGTPMHIDYLDNENIELLIVYPDEKSLKLYKDRFIKRGNNIEYINKVTNKYDEELRGFKRSKSKKVVLENGEPLEDYLLKHSYNLIEESR